MLFQTSIPIRDTDENELRDLIQRLAKIAGSEFEIDRRLMVSTDSSFLSTLLESVADAISNGHSNRKIHDNPHVSISHNTLNA